LDVFYGKVQAFGRWGSLSTRARWSPSSEPTVRARATLLKAISGTLHVKGTIEFEGRSLVGLKPEERGEAGRGPRAGREAHLPGLTVVENLQVAAYAVGKPNKQVQPDIDRVLGIFPTLASRKKSYGWSALRWGAADARYRPGDDGAPPGVAAGRTVAWSGAAAGPGGVPVITEIRAEGTPSFWWSRSPNGLSVADRGYVLDTGEVVQEGPARQLLEDKPSWPPISVKSRAAPALRPAN